MASYGSSQPSLQPTEPLVPRTDVEFVRLRPRMYIGETGSRGLHHLLFELTTNSLEEAVAGHGRSVRLTLRTDGSVEIADDGSLPPSIEPVERLFATLGCGHGYRPYPNGRNYFFYVIANAVSERFQVTVRSDGSRHQHVFRRGVTDAVLQSGGPPGDRGLTITFRPDPEIFGDAQFNVDEIRNRLRLFAFAHSGIRITFTDETTGTHDEFEHADGILDYVRALNEDRAPLHTDVIMLRGEEQGVRYEVGLQWCEDADEEGMSFATGLPTPDGGTHASGLRSGVTRGLHDFIREHRPQVVEVRGNDLRSGLTAVVSVWLSQPCFESQSRLRLNSPEVEAIVAQAVRHGVREYLEANREVAQRVVNAIIAARAGRGAEAGQRKQHRQSQRGE